MFPASFEYPSIFKLFCFALILVNIIAAPTPAPKTLYDVFIESLKANKCQMPKEIDHPFEKASHDPTTFDYLSGPLKECQISEDMKDDEVAPMLCKEIFEVLQNITCSHVSLSPLNVTELSGEVCDDFIGMKGILPSSEQDKYLSGKLVDRFFCKFFCEKKFKSLCQTLLWSHNVQAQIKNALKVTVTEDIKASENQGSAVDEPVEDENKGVVNVNVPNIDSTVGKPTEDKNRGVSDNTPSNEIDVNVNNAQLEPVLGGEDKYQKYEEDQPLDPDLNSKNINPENNNLDVASPDSKMLVTSMPSKEDTLSIIQKHTKILKSTSPAQNEVVGMETNATNQQNPVQVQTGNGKSVNLGDSGEVKKETLKPDENKVSGNTKPRKTKTNDQTSKTSVNEKSTAVVAESNKDIASSTTQDEGSNKISTAVISNKENSITVNLIPTNNPEENELDNHNLEAPKETNLAVPLTPHKETEKPKETKSGMSNKGAIVTNIKLESTTFQSYSEDDDRDAEQYLNDTENEDYSLSADFENDDNIKEKNTKSSAGSEVSKPNKDIVHDNFDLSQNIRQGQEVNPMISPFPEQEDSHFFFYFLSMVLILMAGYLLFHNKQKIIALIVEGRHERRRRSHGAGYKKLDTK